MNTQLTANQAECIDDATDRLRQAGGALSAFISVLKQAKEFNVLPLDLYALLRPIYGEVTAALNDLEVMQGK